MHADSMKVIWWLAQPNKQFMYSIWSFFTQRKNFSYLVLIALTISGLFSVTTIQKESNPEVEVPVGFVQTTFPGASAADIETLITNEIESALSGSLENVRTISSLSSNGVSSITVEFDANADLDKSIQDLKDRVDTVVFDLPEEASEPRVRQIDFSQDPVLTFAVTGNLLPSEFTRLGQQLEDELERIPGVSSVFATGLRDREIHVIVNQEALKSFGLALTDVTQAIARANATLPVGAIQFDEVNYNLEFNAEIVSPQEIANIPVVTRGGTPIYVRDVAFVSDGLTDATSLSRVSLEGKPSRPALSFNVQKQGGGNITEITRAVQDRLLELQAPGELLEELDTLIIFDTGDLLVQDLTSLATSGVLAVMLVMMILLVSIGWRESLVAGLSIPLSFMIAFVGLLMSGNTLNFVSLFALILSVGVLVDSAIVVVEGIHTNMKKNPEEGKREAALKTIRDFHAPITAGTMTTIAVFVPLFFISGIVGEFIKSIPFTVISVLVASLVVALGFIPLIASLVLRRRTTSRLEMQQEMYTSKALTWYKYKLKNILNRPRYENAFLALIIGLFLATPILPIKGIFAALLFLLLVGFTLYYFFSRKVRWFFIIPGTLLILFVSGFLASLIPTFAPLKVEFFPAGNEDYLIVEAELTEGTTLHRTDLEARKIEEILYTEPAIESFVMTVGASSAFSGTGASSGSKFANAFIELKDDREFTSLELGDILTDKLSAVRTSDIRVTQLAGGPPVGTPIVITFKGPQLEELNQLAVEAARLLRSIPGTNAVTTSTKNDNTEFILTIDRAKAALRGIDPQQVALALRTAVEGTEATVLRAENNTVDVVVKLNLNPNYRSSEETNNITLDALLNLEITTQRGSVILGSIVDADIKKGSTAIQHENGQRVATAQSELSEVGNVAEIIRLFQEQAKDQLTIPEGVEMIIGGENEETDQSFAEMGYAILAGLVLMFAIIVLMFNSFRHALYVIAPAFFSFIGIALGLLITGNALSFPSLMGLIALVGIVVNNSIILIDVINKMRRENPTAPIQEIVLEGSALRLRPILLTTITTVIGIMPLLFASSLWAPLALSIIFGLSFSVAITLLFIPIIYSRWPGTLD